MQEVYIRIFIFGLSVIFISACSCRNSNSSISEFYCHHDIVAKIKIIGQVPDSTTAHPSTKGSISSSVDINSNLLLSPSDNSLKTVDSVSNDVRNLNQEPPLRTYKQSSTEQSYHVQFLKVYKNSTNHHLNTTIYTPPSAALCGIRFLEGAEYLLFANSNGGNKTETGLCFGNQIWSSLSESSITTLEKLHHNDTCSNTFHNGTHNRNKRTTITTTRMIRKLTTRKT